MPNTNDKRAEIKALFDGLINELCSSQKHLRKIKGDNPELLPAQKKMIKDIDKIVEKIKSEAETAVDVIPWDRLVIAFFGETNAGKSTIIETFRILFEKNRQKGDDGLIVGDGQQDFTQEYHQYEMEINGKPFTLIDVPGIEGNEAVYHESIMDALHKAHIVFYVHCHDKKPDTGTAAKIKLYLTNWVKVYSIYNVPGQISSYKRPEKRETLLSQDVQRLQTTLPEFFKDTIGEVYCDNFTLQGLLALCSVGDFSDKRIQLARTKLKIPDCFGSLEQAYAFSQFDALIKFVESKAENFAREIADSNQRKVIAMAKFAKDVIDARISQDEAQLSSLKNRLEDFRKQLETLFTTAKRDIRTHQKRITNSAFCQYKQSLFALVDNKPDDISKKANCLKHTIESKLNRELSQRLNTIVSELKESLSDKRKSLKGDFPELNLDFTFDCHIDISIAVELDDLDFNFEDFGNYAFSISSSAAAGFEIGSLFGGPLAGGVAGGVVGGVVGGVGYFFFGKDKKADAKNKLSKSIEKSKTETYTQTERIMESKIRMIDKSKETFCKIISDEIKRYEELRLQTSKMRRLMDGYICIN